MPEPATAAEALALLDEGSAGFARAGSVDVEHRPFAAVLGCSDARVPVELVLGQASNHLFVVRVAGAVAGADCVGSLHYAVQNLRSVKLVVVLGHDACGAVTAAVDALRFPETYLEVVHDPPQRGIVDSLLVGVRMGVMALEAAHGEEVQEQPGFRSALIELATLANAAITATVLDRDLTCDVVFGVYDLHQRTVGVPGDDRWAPGLVPAPADDAVLARLLRRAADLIAIV